MDDDLFGFSRRECDGMDCGKFAELGDEARIRVLIVTE